jgi:DNA polymerase-3 subunit gamma/tau
MDTDAIRRAWPEVLGRIFGMRRATWTFVSQNAQVVGFDGKKLTLGIATVGLTNTFRAGNHAEIVRQALIDELGIDAVVDGVPQPDAGAGQAAVAPSSGSFVTDSAPSGLAPSAPAAASSTSALAPNQAESKPSGASQSAHGQSDSQQGSNRSNVSRSLEDNAGWGSVSAPAPDWATAPGPAPVTDTVSAGRSASVEPSASPSVGSATGSGASAVRESLGAARREGPTGSAAGPATDDSAVSDDDEDIEVSSDVGRAVIEKVLGGRVISELNE